MKCTALIALVAAAIAVRAQVIKDVPPPSPSTTPDYTYDCTKLDYQSEGCKSYNEMVSKGDKDIISAFGSHLDSFVCFRPNEDTFFVLSFNNPIMVASPGQPGVSKAFGFFSYQRIKDGVADDTDAGTGEWSQYKMLGDGPSFSSANANPRLSVTDTEIDYGKPFKNLAGTMTQYNLQIRRSTLRFNETYTAPTVSKSPKTQSAPENQMNIEGYCTEFQTKQQP